MASRVWRGVRSRARALAERRYGLARAWSVLRFRLAHVRRGRPVVVHQMGKVGSKSVVRALERSALGDVVYHTHYLSAETLAAVERVFRDVQRVTGRAIIAPHMVAGRYLRRRWERDDEARPWKLISLVRDPVARNVSAFFNAFHLYFPEYGRAFARDPSNVPELRELFLHGFEFENGLPLRWFDTEVERVFGIDVFDSPFPHARGRALYRGEGVELLVLRLEDLEVCGERALCAFLGLERVRPGRAHTGDGKDYGDAYRRFRAAVRLPEAYLDRMYGSAYARHFYTAAERREFRDRWSR